MIEFRMVLPGCVPGPRASRVDSADIVTVFRNTPWRDLIAQKVALRNETKYPELQVFLSKDSFLCLWLGDDDRFHARAFGFRPMRVLGLWTLKWPAEWRTRHGIVHNDAEVLLRQFTELMPQDVLIWGSSKDDGGKWLFRVY